MMMDGLMEEPRPLEPELEKGAAEEEDEGQSAHCSTYSPAFSSRQLQSGLCCCVPAGARQEQQDGGGECERLMAQQAGGCKNRLRNGPGGSDGWR